jgi:hypothetical protein
MTGFKTIPPKQRYMTLAEIYESYGERAVVAYHCRVKDAAPLGGFVIAVQDKPEKEYKRLKEYMNQFQSKYPQRKPVFFIRFEEGEKENHLTFVYDSGSNEIIKDSVDEIKEKKSKMERTVEKIPAELLAKALSTHLRKEG